MIQYEGIPYMYLTQALEVCRSHVGFDFSLLYCYAMSFNNTNTDILIVSSSLPISYNRRTDSL